ncbi:MAG: single-stranded-DNA-specific exonuclease RecJ [Candidatus Hydrogenedentes bacterium]|nr:single-stranded-DNA-specific exonuclease RecJ [Candidatus Hydrogenedentota bacterium]
MVDHARGMCEWKLAPDNRAEAQALAQQLEIAPAVARVLVLRGASQPAIASRFLNPDVSQLSDPIALTDMQRAVDRIARAREKNETVLIFGDYDVDGISGTALMYSGLRRYGIEKCIYGMPNRLLEGYGLSADRVDWAAAQGVSLLITVDNGVAAFDAIARAKELGIDVIVTDHHLIERGLPDAYAVINPKREADDHPAANLCGSGVALKLVQALAGELHDLDLAALGTVADVVPLTGENRVIVAAGLAYASQKKRLGLSELASISKVTLESLKSEDIAFQIAPRINAGGRMGDGIAGLKLLLTESYDEARAMAEELDAANEERKAIESDTLAEAISMLKHTFTPEHRSIVLSSRTWHRGVIGIVASRLQATHYRPVVLVAVDGDGVGRGSARSIAGFNIAAAIEQCVEHLQACGGHAMAAGLTLREECFAAFQEAFETCAKDLLPEGELRRVLDIDAQVALTEIDTRLVRTLDKLQPFGQGNPAPVFCAFGVRALQDSWRELRGGHMKFVVKDGPKLLDVIGFRMADRIPTLARADAIDIAFTPQLNTWRDQTTVQLVLKDARVAAG